jgi:hypothetical protein
MGVLVTTSIEAARSTEIVVLKAGMRGRKRTTWDVEATVVFSVWMVVCSSSRVPRRHLKMDPHSPALQHRSVPRVAFIPICPLGLILEFLPFHTIATGNSYRREIGIQLGTDGSRS